MSGTVGNDNIERIRQPRKKAPFIIIAILAVIAIIVISNSLVVTMENEYTLVKQFGKIEKIVPEAGLSFKVPFIQTTDTLPNTLLIYDLTQSDVITEDKKTMVVDSYVLWKIVDPLKFVQTLTLIPNAESRINTIVYNSMKNVISSMEQQEVITSRDGVLNEMIMNNIGSTMDQYGIKFISIETKHLDLPSDNKAAVYERMISERNNIAASYTASGESDAKKIRTETDNEIVVSVSEAEAKAEKIISEGEAEYMKILSDAYNDEGKAEFYNYLRSLDSLSSLVGEDKTLILDTSSELAKILSGNH